MTNGPNEQTTELEQLRAECERLRRERDSVRADLKAPEGRAEFLAAAQLQLHAANLSKEIKSDFWESVKRGLWITALLASVATAGGIFTLSDILKTRIDSAVQGKHKEIEKLREGFVNALVDVKLRAESTNREVETLKAEVATAKKQFIELRRVVEHEGQRAITSIRGVIVSVTQTVDASGETITTTSAAPTQASTIPPTMGRPPGNGSAWFGSLPPRLVGIAGSDFNQVGQEEGGSGKSQGAFSSWFQKMLKEAGADTDRNGWVTLRKAVQATASRGIKSTQAEGMGSFGWH